MSAAPAAEAKPAYIAAIDQGVAVIKAEFAYQLQRAHGDMQQLRNARHFFRNRPAAEFGEALQKAHALAMQLASSSSSSSSSASGTDNSKILTDFIAELMRQWRDLVAWVFSNTPPAIAAWICTDGLLFRARGKAQTAYSSFVMKQGILFQGVIDEHLATSGGVVGHNDDDDDDDDGDNNDDEAAGQASAAGGRGRGGGRHARRAYVPVHVAAARMQRQLRNNYNEQQMMSDGSNDETVSVMSLRSLASQATTVADEVKGTLLRRSKIPSLYANASANNPSQGVAPAAATDQAASAGSGGTQSPVSASDPVPAAADGSDKAGRRGGRGGRGGGGGGGQKGNCCLGSDSSSNSNDNRYNWRDIVRTQREENTRIAEVLHAIFAVSSPEDTTSSSTESNNNNKNKKKDDKTAVAKPPLHSNSSEPIASISLHALHEICRTHGALSTRHANDDYSSDPKVQRQFSKRVFDIVHRSMIRDCHLAITNDNVINVAFAAALQTAAGGSQAGAAAVAQWLATASAPSTSAAAGGAAGAGGASSAGGDKHQLHVEADPTLDQYFILMGHMLLRHFKIKGSADYAGHNICCVFVDTASGKVFGSAYNQCKQEQNLCAHAERLLCDALVQSLKVDTGGLPGKPVSLSHLTCISSLASCHMCSNYLSRMGITRHGYWMTDPMQMQSTNVTAMLCGNTLLRPSASAAMAETCERAFSLSGMPEEEITSYLGCDEFRALLLEMCKKWPLPAGSESEKFFKLHGASYPGVVLVGKAAAAAADKSNSNNSKQQQKQESDDDNDGMMVQSTSQLLATAQCDDIFNQDETEDDLDRDSDQDK